MIGLEAGGRECRITTKPCSWSEGLPKHSQLQLSVIWLTVKRVTLSWGKGWVNEGWRQGRRNRRCVICLMRLTSPCERGILKEEVSREVTQEQQCKRWVTFLVILKVILKVDSLQAHIYQVLWPSPRNMYNSQTIAHSGLKYTTVNGSSTGNTVDLIEAVLLNAEQC